MNQTSTRLKAVADQSKADAAESYTGDAYANSHPDWHLGDAANKVGDIHPLVSQVLREAGASAGPDRLRICDVGAGAGGVLAELTTRLQKDFPGRTIDPEMFEISEYACDLAARRFPHLRIRRQFFTGEDGPYDLTLMIDVLEHLENPWQLLRAARKSSRFLVVRQPLLENLGTFRHKGYANQRRTWGHIGFFTYRGFLDMALACGWKPRATRLCAAHELHGKPRARRGPRDWVIDAIIGLNRELASILMSGFYVNGVFEHAEVGAEPGAEGVGGKVSDPSAGKAAEGTANRAT